MAYRWIRKKSRARNPNLLRGTFGADPPRCEQCGMFATVLTAPYCNSCLNQLVSKDRAEHNPQMWYIIPQGSKCCRVNELGSAETFVTTREVRYNESELEKEYKNDTNKVVVYRFRLPSEAAPWKYLEVKVEDVNYETRTIHG